jgi:hypothetical protein
MRFPPGNVPILLILLAGACSPLKTYSATADQPASGGVGSPSPATIAPFPGLATENAGATQAKLPNSITLADNGSTLTMDVGQDFLLNLGGDTLEWTVDIDNQDVLSRVKNVMVIRGAQGMYEAVGRGNAVLTAQGDPHCRSSVPPCMMPSMLFRISIVVP